MNMTLVELADAINSRAALVDEAESAASNLLAQALKDAVIVGQLLIEARSRVKVEKKKGNAGWVKWLETNYAGVTASAYRYISLAENFDLIRDAASRTEALHIIDEYRKATIIHGNRRQTDSMVVDPRSMLKQRCERCNFDPEHAVQLEIHHKDGNHYNNHEWNLQTLCANCHVLLKLGPGWLKKAV